MTDPALRSELAALHPACHGWAQLCCRWDRADAEDVLQSAYLKVLDGSARFDGRCSARTWLFAVIRRTAAERRRRDLLRQIFLRRWAGLAEEDLAADPQEALADGEAVMRLRFALLRLSQRQRELLHLVFYQEITVEEAACVLGISVGSARTHYHRGKARLRAILGDECK